jgi:flagellar hook-associated protein 2
MPLSDEQRRDMSDREIEMWESQARTGLLHRDDALRNLTNSLHRALFQDVQLADGSSINLLHLGIRTHSDLERFGELQIDEARLESFLENRLDDVATLFTRFSNIPATGAGANRRDRLADSGIGQRINDILTWELSVDGGIAERAGLRGHVTENENALSRRINAEERRIENMLRDLERREHRYFQLFGRLEAAMIQSNSQMMFLEQMFWMG